eukprot:INCI17311.1.p1 GENE.INCI17311.1~~INCI17311.1.p1  ORF type:complete len:709 (+),score=110.86 INCI17311.1:167-2293(+)
MRTSGLLAVLTAVAVQPLLLLAALGAQSVANAEASSVNPEALRWLWANLDAQIEFLRHPANETVVGARDLPNGALAVMMAADPDLRANSKKTFGEKVVSYEPLSPSHPACVEGVELLHRFGDRFDMSFGGQAQPLIYHTYKTCFNESEWTWFVGALNASLPQTVSQATSQEVSYTNMWLMAATETVLYGEIFAGDRGGRGDKAAALGHAMLEKWVEYTKVSGIHEFNSPTYTYVQLTSLYTGFIHTTNITARGYFEYAIDMIWATTCANVFAGTLSGPHSRDYDTLLGHGMLFIEMYLHGLPEMQPLQCEYGDPHCEGTLDSARIGTFEPMTVVALSLYNVLHPNGYQLKSDLRELADLDTVEVDTRFLGQTITANGNSDKFSQVYNYIRRGLYAIGSASQSYITNTHSKFFPCPHAKIVNIVLGDSDQHQNMSTRTPAWAVGRNASIPAVTIQPDWMDAPYGVWADYGNWNSLGKATHLAYHPGMVQFQNVLLATVALNGQDLLDGFTLYPDGNLYPGLATNIILPRFADEFVLVFPNGSTSAFIVPTETFQVDLPIGTTVAVRVGKGGVAARVFYADGVDSNGQLVEASPYAVQLKGDAVGMDLAAIRIAVYHMQPRSLDNPLNVTASTVQCNTLFIADEVAADGNSLTLTQLAQRAAGATPAVEKKHVEDYDEVLISVKLNQHPDFGDALSLGVQRNISCAVSRD